MYKRIAISTATTAMSVSTVCSATHRANGVDRLNATSKAHPNTCASTYASAKNVRKIQFRTTLCTAAITRCDAFASR